MSGLRVPHATLFGDPEALPILSARAGEVVKLATTVEDGVILATMPARTLAIELSIEHAGDVGAQVRYLVVAAAPADAAAASTAAGGGIVRRVPVGAQFIEFRHAIAGDTLIVDTLTGAVAVTVHAHLEAP